MSEDCPQKDDDSIMPVYDGVCASCGMPWEPEVSDGCGCWNCGCEYKKADADLKAAYDFIRCRGYEVIRARKHDCGLPMRLILDAETGCPVYWECQKCGKVIVIITLADLMPTKGNDVKA